MTTSSSIREALRALPSLAATSSGQPPQLQDIFFPESHAEALDPDVSLVIGNRGMGKTFWSLALSDKHLRPEIAKRYLGTRHLRLDNLEVYLGFADAEGARGEVSRLNLESIPKRISPELIWRAVLIRRLAPLINRGVPSGFKELASWIKANPEEQLEIFREADKFLTDNGRRTLFVFDQLDQLATDWNRIILLTQGLLKTALAMKSYRSIKVKLFMRPDQAENKQLFQFPDASKILGGRCLLSWKTTDLYGLLFFEILRLQDGRGAFEQLCVDKSVSVSPMHSRLGIPEELVGNAEKQSQVFDAIAGSQMGLGSKRGRPYTWIPAHLADGRGEISPRTFLHVIKTAAEHSVTLPPSTAIDFQGIQEGVRRASSSRLAELEEDYPWVSSALEPLRGLLVPCLQDEILDRWVAGGTADALSNNFHGSRAPIDLVFAQLFAKTRKEGTLALLKALREIGVMEIRSNGKINVPDIFRVNAGILRKGGVTPQQRRRL